MNIKELRIGNIVDFETIAYVVKGISSTETERLIVKALLHDWSPEECGLNEVEGIELTPELLKENGFTLLNNAMPHLWIKEVGGHRYIRYHDEVRYMEFEHMNVFARIPWQVRYLHQMQNACTDYGLKVELSVRRKAKAP